jgi:L-arabinose isomerase
MRRHRWRRYGRSKSTQGWTLRHRPRAYHGKVGRGPSVEMSVKHRPVTLLSVVHTVDGKLKLLVAEGESIAGPA